MAKKFVMLAAVLALCCGAFAQEEGGDGGEGEKPKKEKKARPARKLNYKSILRGDPLVARLGLTEEQVAKVKEMEAETKAAFEKLVQEAGEDKKKLREAMLKLPELYDALRAKILELLNDDQKKKYEAGVAVLAEFKTKKEAITAEMKAAKDREKKKEAQKKLRGLRAELEKALDEKVGPRAGKPARAPKKKKDKKPKPPEGEGDAGGGDDAANAEF